MGKFVDRLRSILRVRSGQEKAKQPPQQGAEQDKRLRLTAEELAAIIERYSLLGLADRLAGFGMSEQDQYRRIAELEARLARLELAIDRALRCLAVTGLVALLALGFYLATYLR